MTPSKPVLDMTQGTVAARPRQKFANAKAWTRQSLSPADWTVKIDDAVKKELDGVVRMTRRQALPVMLLDPIDFDLPASRAMMGRVKNVLDDGHGFTVIDRLPMDDWSEDEARAMYWLLGRLMSRQVAQTAKGEIFREVHNDGNKSDSGRDRSTTDRRLIYHNDNSANRNLPNYTSLLCLNKAKEGGHSEYVTVYSIFNALADEAPVELDRLFKPFYHDRLGIQSEGESPLLWAPALAWDGQKLLGRYSINKIGGGYRIAGEEMDNETRSALETVIAVVGEKQLSARFLQERGQIQVINNREGLHHRDDFVDGDTQATRRHLVRFWFRNQGRAFFDG